MSPRPIIVLADDLTGAAEIAAAAHAAGWRAVVDTAAPSPTAADATKDSAEVIVHNLDTRLARPAVAARRAAAWTTRLGALASDRRHHANLFLKFDSVLRGPVLGQLAAVLRALPRPRALLVPANPSIGRVLHHGRYTIAGRPLHETAFARDPHHPRNSSDPLELLGRSRRAHVTLLAPDASDLPTCGVLVGETATPADVAHWVERLPSDTLPAGGAEFFNAWLEKKRSASRPSRPASSRASTDLRATPSLLLHGSTATPAPSEAVVLDATRPPDSARLADRLRAEHAATLAVPGARLSSPDAPAALARAFARAAVDLRRRDAFRHLIIVGGATASAVLSSLGWTTLEVLHVWGSGVVTLQPLAEPDFFLTLKPGSYPWPDSLRRALPASLFA